jgi:hypothetical protein
MPEVTPGDWTDTLRARLMVNEAILSIEDSADGGLTVEVPLRERWFMRPPFSIVFPFRRTRRLELDSLGARVFRSCSNNCTVEELVDAFGAEERLSFHESRITVAGYLRTLMQNGLIAVELPPGSPEGPAPSTKR